MVRLIRIQNAKVARRRAILETVVVYIAALIGAVLVCWVLG